MKILIHGRHFPVAMFRFFDWSFKDLGHDVFTVGPYQGGKIPWGDYDFKDYAFAPDFVLPEENIPIKEVLARIDFKPDFILQAADTIYLPGESPVPNCILMTDPHAVDYEPRLVHADYVFNMQDCYRSPGQTWIPYGYYPPIHKALDMEQNYDVVLCGLQYDNRRLALEGMKEKGLRVFNALGVIYEEYTDTYNQGKIAFNYSSRDDLPARFWEGLAMRRMVLTNRVPDLKKLEFIEGVDYVAFTTIEEAIEKAVYYSSHEKERLKIAQNGYDKVKLHTYKTRCLKILQKVTL